ncbi:MAG: prepilin-type N-terminal cleavage/methylation domain-containing protein [Comamonadaceae bacterium]|nr:MAG: prepilin-type N-terminal cleavage/methylation domain-containing protein [Comamonadaceae bacterium]
MPVKHRRSYRGFTTIELMVVVAIVAVLMALAAPSFGFLIERWRVLQAVDGLKTTLYYGRSEAIRRGSSIYLEKIPKTGSSGCVSDDTDMDWDCGWVVFADANNNQRWDAGEEIQRFDAPRSIKVSRTESLVTITLNRWGTLDSGALGFTVSPSSNVRSSATKGVCMTPAGRIRVINQEDVPCT